MDQRHLAHVSSVLHHLLSLIRQITLNPLYCQTITYLELIRVSDLSSNHFETIDSREFYSLHHKVGHLLPTLHYFEPVDSVQSWFLYSKVYHFF